MSHRPALDELASRLPGAHVLSDPESDLILHMSPAAAALLGYAAGEALGEPVASLVPERFRARHAAGLARFRAEAGGEPFAGTGAMALPFLTRAGDEVVLETRMSLVSAGGRELLVTSLAPQA